MEHIHKYTTLSDNNLHLAVIHIGHENHTRKHFHDFFEFVFVERGFSMHKLGDHTSLLLTGDIFFVLPGTIHEYWKSVNTFVYNCLFYPEVLGEDLNELLKLPMLDEVLQPNARTQWKKIHLRPNDRYEILGLLKKLESETTQRPLGWVIRSKAMLVDFLVCLSRVWSNDEKNTLNIHTDVTGSASGILHILELSLKNKMSIEDMARESGYSSEYFSKVFKTLTGLSPLAYLISMRIATAAEKLLDPNVSISDAAELTGFEDVNYFSRLFKKETGMTPSEFKNIRF